MIALIDFSEPLVIERSEAEKLNLTYKEYTKFGKSCSYSKRIEPLKNSNDYYNDELYFEDEKYYTDNTKAVEVSDYNRYQRLEEKDWVYVESSNHMVNLEYFALNCKYPYSIKKCLRSEEPNIQNFSSLIGEIEDKFSKINKDLELFRNQQMNQKVNVHVGGGLIVTYNDLLLKEDCCTDELQECVTQGWRIIAVCMQPDQRRPDYVLGRYNSDFDCATSAKREV